MFGKFSSGHSEKGKERHEELYSRSYGASLSVIKNVAPFLNEDDETRARLVRSVQSISCLIASDLCGGNTENARSEAIGDAVRMCREAVVMLSYCKDLHGRFINGSLCDDLMDVYRFIGKELEAFVSIQRTTMEGLGC